MPTYPTTDTRHLIPDTRKETPTMSRFASKELVAIHADDEPRDIVYVHAEATLGMQRRINKRFLQMRQEAGGAAVSVWDPSEYSYAVLTAFIARWEGPGFEGRKFSEQALAEMDADDALLAKVLKEIIQRNPRFKDEDADGEESEASPNGVTPHSEPVGAQGSKAAKSK
jgi:hypothetical protein